MKYIEILSFKDIQVIQIFLSPLDLKLLAFPDVIRT